jgi:PAS domain S-box-containing protein
MLYSSQRAQLESKTSITKVMSILGAFAACVFAIAIPSVYYVISINETRHTLTIEAAFLAKSIEKIIQSRPDLWSYESVRLTEFISQPSVYGGKDEREIRNAAGALLTKTDFTASRPIISVSTTFFDSGRLAGSIVVRHSVRSQIITTALSGILSSLLGCLLYFIFRTYPLRKLENTLIDLQRERDKSDKTLSAIGDGVISVDPEGMILLINRVAESLVGMDTSAAMGRQLEEVYVLRQGQENQVGEKGCILTSKGGNEYAIEEVRTPLTEVESDESGVVIVFRDITERKRAGEALQRAHDELEQRVADRTEELMRVNEELRTEITERTRAEEAIVAAKNDWENTFDTVPDMITIHDEDFNIVRANPAAREMFGLQLQEGIPFAKCFRSYHGTEKPPTECTSCQCLQTGRPSTVEMFEPYLNKHLEIRAMPRFGNDGRLVGLIHVVRDITERKQAEKHLQDTLNSLRKAVGVTIQTMVSAVEARDPYTAGHQTRSANLARAIATEMGLPQEKIDGIRMAGSIHDIGKLSIPAEILSKPTRLSEIEFSLIKEHARQGFEILKGVESPWPLAEMVYQHHERMDGSGYPRHLRGDDILPESRIIAVADVVEAIASHRPYRPALGIDAAMEEISKNRDTFYDPEVVDACLRVFREKGYSLH